MKNPWIIIGIITVVLFGGAILISNESTADNNEGVEVRKHIKGNSEASVKLVEYSDFQCPSCASFHPVVKTLIEQYGEKISFEYKHFPLSTIHKNALGAAIAAEAAGQQDKFFEFHDLLFENQGEWSAVAVPNTLFLKYAEQLNLDLELFKKHLKSSVLRDKVRSEFDEGRSLEVAGTPTFFLNGERMEFTSFPEFLEKVNFAIDPSLVNTLNASGTPVSNDSAVKFGI
jgi:protein-disulfide isomerase